MHRADPVHRRVRGDHHAPAMLDTGSQVDIITRDAAENLGFDIQESTLEIVGVGSARSQRALGRIEFSILLPDHKQYKVTCDVLNQVVGDLCIGRMPPKFLDKFDGYDLADPNFHKAKKIDVLLGVIHFPHLVLNYWEQIDNMWLLHTVFGWAVTGQPNKTVAKKCTRRVQFSGPIAYSVARVNLPGVTRLANGKKDRYKLDRAAIARRRLQSTMELAEKDCQSTTWVGRWGAVCWRDSPTQASSLLKCTQGDRR